MDYIQYQTMFGKFIWCGSSFDGIYNNIKNIIQGIIHIKAVALPKA